jgi:mannose/fructose/N-acetylgalactosamine-specific phosphotransferase system component IIC
MDPVLSIALLSGALATDNRSSLRLLVSQPVCGGLLVGFVLGNPGDGLLAGAILQMLFLGVVPVRGLGMIDLPLGGVTVSSLYILVPRSAAVDPAARGLVLLLALAASLGVAWAGGALYRLWEGRSHGIADAALRLSGKGHFGLAAALHFSTVGVHFAFGFAVAAAVVLGGAPAVARVAAAAAPAVRRGGVARRAQLRKGARISVSGRILHRAAGAFLRGLIWRTTVA